MLVQRILDFIKTLEMEDNPISCDVTLRDHLTHYFATRNVEEELNKEDIEFLIICYKNRWNNIQDREYDYTRNPSVINLHWIGLAKDLESAAKKSYLKILIPTITNDNDLNNLSPLTDTVNLFNFYLGNGGSTLFRKIAFYEHLKSWDFALSTYRSLIRRKLSPVSVEELARLKWCKGTSGQVADGNEVFVNFWDFMRKKVFIHLSDHGQVPRDLIPHLLELIEKFHYLNANKLPFSIFQRNLKDFFCRLDTYDLADVNSLYGAKIDYKEHEEYLLDVFIALHTANDFSELSYEMHSLSKWLFHYNLALQNRSNELEKIYLDLTPDDFLMKSKKSQSETFAHCGSLLVSLFSNQFEFSIFEPRYSESFWDKSNNVFFEAKVIIRKLLPFVVENQTDELLLAYDDIIKNVIIPAREGSSQCIWFTRDKSINKWFELAQQGQLSDMNAYWYEPELLFASLLHFHTNNLMVRAQVSEFLDNLIHSYTQDKNNLMKQLRANILFMELLDDLSEDHCRDLLEVINLCDLKSAKSNFIRNCTTHINDRLSYLSQTMPENGLSPFFPSIRKVDSRTLFNIPKEINDLSRLVIEYKTQLSDLLEPKLAIEKMSVYLLKISQPILTAEEKESTKSCSITMDYIGQYI